MEKVKQYDYEQPARVRARAVDRQRYEGYYFGPGENDVNVILLNDIENYDKFTKEVNTLRNVLHMNIVRVFGKITRDDHVKLLTEIMAGGLDEYLEKNANSLSLIEVVRFAADISRGMQYMHERGMAHGGLNIANLLLTDHNEVKISLVDGANKLMGSETLDEVDLERKKEMDIRCFGVVISEMIGVNPKLRHNKLVNLIKRCGARDKPPFRALKSELEEFYARLDSIRGRKLGKAEVSKKSEKSKKEGKI